MALQQNSVTAQDMQAIQQNIAALFVDRPPVYSDEYIEHWGKIYDLNRLARVLPSTVEFEHFLMNPELWCQTYRIETP